MTQPLRLRRDYMAVGRKTFLVEQLPDGALPIYDKDPDVTAYVVGEEGENIVNGAVLTSAVTIRILKRLIDAEEERCEKAVRGGKRPRRAKSSEGKSLNGVLEDVMALVGQREDVLKDLKRAILEKKFKEEFQKELKEKAEEKIAGKTTESEKAYAHAQENLVGVYGGPNTRWEKLVDANSQQPFW